MRSPLSILGSTQRQGGLQVVGLGRLDGGVIRVKHGSQGLGIGSNGGVHPRQQQNADEKIGRIFSSPTRRDPVRDRNSFVKAPRPASGAFGRLRSR